MGPGLYLHVPFCARACPYCDFDFLVGRRPDVDHYLTGLQRELEGRALELREPFDTLYLGGGTPSMLGVEGLARLVALLGDHVELGALAESTIELNPEHASAELLDAVRALGFDRVSLGVQSFAPTVLQSLGRVHEAEAGRAALEAAASRGLRVSADLIVGVPGQTLGMVEEDVRVAAGSGVEHISAYALTIEGSVPWTSLVRRGLRVLPDDDLQAEALMRVREALERAGFEHYEISSYARSPSGRARHNAKYWRGVDVVGLGPSAHGARHGPGFTERRGNPRGLRAWADSAPLAATEERLEGAQAASEALWLGLRQLQGVALAPLMARFPSLGPDFWEAKIAPLSRLGHLESAALGAEGEGVRVAPGRWLLHDEIAMALL